MSAARNGSATDFEAIRKTLVLARASSMRINDDSEVPQACKIVAKRVPLALDALDAIRRNSPAHFTKGEECQRLGERLGRLLEVAQLQCSKMEFFKRYQAVAGEVGGPLEDIMLKLLLRIEEGTRDRRLQGSLREASEEIKRAPSSLEETEAPLPPPPTHVFTNSGSGIQPIHMGRGDLNLNTGGGPQITGQGGNYYFGSSGNAADRPI